MSDETDKATDAFARVRYAYPRDLMTLGYPATVHPEYERGRDDERERVARILGDLAVDLAADAEEAYEAGEALKAQRYDNLADGVLRAGVAIAAKAVSP